MKTAYFVDTIATDAERMSRSAGECGLDVAVPTCPDWTVRDLILHTGIVHRHKAETLRGDYSKSPAPQPDGPDTAMADDEILRWFDQGVVELLDACSSTNLTDSTWTWCPHDHHKAWWVRRMAHETAIHSIDAVIAAGGNPLMGVEFAEDGLAEVLDEFIVGSPSWGVVESTDRVVRLETPNRHWVLRTAGFSGTSPTTGAEFSELATFVYDDDAHPSVVVSSDAVTLDLWLWGRGQLPDAATSGDGSLVSHVRSVAAASTA